MATLLLTEQTDAMFKLWKSQRFFNEVSEGYLPISTVLNDETFDRRQCMDIIRGILRCQFGLHARGLTQNELVLDDIYVKKTSVSIFLPKVKLTALTTLVGRLSLSEGWENGYKGRGRGGGA